MSICAILQSMPATITKQSHSSSKRKKEKFRFNFNYNDRGCQPKRITSKRMIKFVLTMRVSISASIFRLMCRLVWPNDDREHKAKFTSLSVSPLEITTTGVAAALSYNFLMCCGRVSGVNNDVVIARFVL